MPAAADLHLRRRRTDAGPHLLLAARSSTLPLDLTCFLLLAAFLLSASSFVFG